MARKKTSSKAPTKKAPASRARAASRAPSGAGRSNAARAAGKHLVIVESPTKARTINKYLGPDYLVMASVGHVRDLPPRAPKGVKQPVPGVDLDNDFAPTYEILTGKKKTVADLRQAARQAADVWFATDLDREGEAIAWHLAQALDIKLDGAKRVVFNAITQREIQHAFASPRRIDENRVNAQQARRILDRIVGYQVSPLLWKKVAGGLSAGRVQSVAVRFVVEREREIEAFIPDEFWKIAANFAAEPQHAQRLASDWTTFLSENAAPDAEAENANANGDKQAGPTLRRKVAWLNDRRALRAELVSFAGKDFRPDNRDQALEVAAALGFVEQDSRAWQDDKAKGPARNRIQLVGQVADSAVADGAPPYRIRSVETKRTTVRPSAPFITSTLQQAAANQLGFPLLRTMRVAQQLYEGVDIHGKEGQTGLITYMRTDSTHLSPEALDMARSYIGGEWGREYLPDKPNFYANKNKSAQEAHEAIRPTDVSITPRRVRHELTDEQYKLYRLIWERFLASQMTPAQWDSTTVMIAADTPRGEASFKSTGRTLVFDGFYKAVGIPTGDEAILPPLTENQPVAPFAIEPTQHFTSPPPRYTEASLQKKLEEMGIGRPSTYAAIIQTIQDRKYVEPLMPRDRRLRATDLGKVVTDKLIEAFPTLLDPGYTRDMEARLDRIEDEHLDWVRMLHEFYAPFKRNLEKAHDEMVHAKAEMEPAPYKCPKCGSPTVYRFGRNGRFLSCSTYPDCDYAAPIDAAGKPQPPQTCDILCPQCGSAMTRRTGRFGPFLSCENYPTCKGVVKLDKKGCVVLPKVEPLTTDIPCPKCEAPLYLRDSKRGLWLSCSKYPKCRGRVGFSALDADKQKALEAAWSDHHRANPAPVVRRADGQSVEEGYAPQLTGESLDATTPAADMDAA